MTNTNAKKIRVLVVDDSVIQREILARAIDAAPDMEVVARAKDAYEARDKILEFHPDVMTCDIQMPRMDGIEFVRKLIPQYALPVIVISSLSEAVFEALDAGAVDFIAKPSVSVGNDKERFINEVVGKIRIASAAKVKTALPKASARGRKISAEAAGKKLIAIGASTGGTEAIFRILKELPPTAPGIVIVQHIPPVFSRLFAERLNRQTNLEVKEAETGDEVIPGRVLVAPGDKHLRVSRVGSLYKAECKAGEKVSGHCPSADVLFKSAARAAGKNAVGVILTGMGADGAEGLLEMRRAGARTIGQNERSSVVYGMPRAAFSIGAVERQAELSDIPDLICAALKSPQ